MKAKANKEIMARNVYVQSSSDSSFDSADGSADGSFISVQDSTGDKNDTQDLKMDDLTNKIDAMKIEQVKQGEKLDEQSRIQSEQGLQIESVAEQVGVHETLLMYLLECKVHQENTVNEIALEMEQFNGKFKEITNGMKHLTHILNAKETKLQEELSTKFREQRNDLDSELKSIKESLWVAEERIGAEILEWKMHLDSAIEEVKKDNGKERQRYQGTLLHVFLVFEESS